MRPVPILLYHSISDHPSAVMSEFTISPAVFSRQLDAIAESRATVLSVSGYVSALESGALPDHPVVMTFDDGYADFYDEALPALEHRGFPCTLYATTGFLESRPALSASHRPPNRIVAWTQLRELVARGVEIGGHSHSHFQLDTLGRQAAWVDITRSKALLEAELQVPVATFAYPHGYSSPALRKLVREAGYVSACGVRNAFSWEGDHRFLLARLTVRETTSDSEFAGWLQGLGAPIAPARELLRTRMFRAYRRGRSLLTGHPGSAFVRDPA